MQVPALTVWVFVMLGALAGEDRTSSVRRLFEFSYRERKTTSA